MADIGTKEYSNNLQVLIDSVSHWREDRLKEGLSATLEDYIATLQQLKNVSDEAIATKKI